MRRVRLAFTNSCSGFGRPRSANTLPAPSVARGLAFFALISILPFSVIALCIRQSLPDEIKVAFRRGRAGLGLLLEGVQHIDGIPKSHSIDGPPCIAGMGRNDFHHAAAAKSLQWLSGRIGFTT